MLPAVQRKLVEVKEFAMDHQTPRILIVDDEREIRDMLRRTLLRQYPGARVDVASSAKEATASMGSQSYDIIVSDYRMPGQDGVSFLRDVKRTSPRTIRILLTAFPEQDAAIRAINEAHLERFLTKPITMSGFVGAIREAWDAKVRENAQYAAFARSFRQLSIELKASRGEQ